MLRTRILLVIGSAAIIWLLFLLPKVVVENDAPLSSNTADSVATPSSDENHAAVPRAVQVKISDFRRQFQASASNEKNAIFADSLANLYVTAGKYDSSAWFAEVAAKFFNTTEGWT